MNIYRVMTVDVHMTEAGIDIVEDELWNQGLGTEAFRLWVDYVFEAHNLARLGVATRTGVHTGECEIAGGKLAGIAVHTGARVAAAAEGGEVLVSGTVKSLVAGSGLRFAGRGRHHLKGLEDELELFAAESLT